jgi:hypothetical protein
MNRLMMTGSMIACWGAASVVLAASPVPIDCPTPPPCAADGTCYPNECTWGWYPCRWRKWPGEELEPTPAGAQPTPAELKGSGLNPYETPTPEHEDTQAPPSTIKKPEGSSSVAPAGEPPAPPEGAAPSRPLPPSGSPAGPSGPPQTAPTRGYSTPSYPTPYRPTPSNPAGARQPTSDADPPPALPRQLSAAWRSPAVADALPAANPMRPSNASRRSNGDDPPPTMPSVFHSAAL